MSIENTRKCVEFTKQMEEAGLVNPYSQSPANTLEQRLEDLKLYGHFRIMPL